MRPTIVSIVSFVGVLAPLISFFVIVYCAGRKSQTQEAQRTSQDKLKTLGLPALKLLLKQLAAGTITVALTIGTPLGLFALMFFFPILTCHGGGSGGNCGEGYMVSAPLALLTVPLDLWAAVFVYTTLSSALWPK